MVNMNNFPSSKLQRGLRRRGSIHEREPLLTHTRAIFSVTSCMPATLLFHTLQFEKLMTH